MVAAGATILMAASEETSSNGSASNSTQCRAQTNRSHNNEIHSNQKTPECSSKKDSPSVSNNKGKSNVHMLDRNSRLIPRTDSKDNNKSVGCHKATTPIRETKASRLRAASITSPNGTSFSKRLGNQEAFVTSHVQPSSSISNKEDNAMSDLANPINPIRERDKSYKRKSYLNRSSNMEASTDHSHQSELSDRRFKRQSNKSSQLSETCSSSNLGIQRQSGSSTHKKHVESKISHQRVNSQSVTSRSKTSTTSAVAPLANTKNSNLQYSSNSGGHSDSEVSRRVDALTALTKATMERVERLTSHANVSTSHGSRTENYSPPSTNSSLSNSAGNVDVIHMLHSSPKKCSILKKSNEEPLQDGFSVRQHAPVSILKHKDAETGQTLSNLSHSALPVTFSPSVVEPTYKKHGILKKRCSLDENEILRRRSCSPDVSLSENSCSEFRPILKNQRRSSLDEIIKRDQSPDPQPASILKRKTSRGDDREDRQFGILEPQGILKRKTVMGSRINNNNHHVTIIQDNAGVSGSEVADNSEVRPILKKKHSREEFPGIDIPVVEPRPILKKKSSTDSDEHEDKPKKTILKCTRKNSQDECNYETESTSPKKLSMLRNRVLQCRAGGVVDSDSVRPILKQSGSRDSESRVRLNFGDDTIIPDELRGECADQFLRKRAQSVGHVQPVSHLSELTNVLTKRRSLELSSMNEILQKGSQFHAKNYHKPSEMDTSQNESDNTIPDVQDTPLSSTGEKFMDKVDKKDKTKIAVFDQQDEKRLNSHLSTHMQRQIEMSDTKDCAIESDVYTKSEDSKISEHYGVSRSNSVSKMRMHFKALQETADSTDKDNVCQRNKSSRGIQRYRARNLQGNDRFNTQPVTLQEVQEAVLQNQRNVVSNEQSKIKSSDENVSVEDEYDPSKLSLAERVRLFNQKIAVENPPTSVRMSQERYPNRRRPTNRYKTQPVTSEEVEVASRISPLHVGQQLSLDSISSHGNNGEDSTSTCQTDLPKSILKPINLHAHIMPRTKSPELEGLKLIKSVLKRETEDVEQQSTSDDCDSFPRSILKTTVQTKQEENGSRRIDRETKEEYASAKNETVSSDVQLQNVEGYMEIHDESTRHDLHLATPGKNSNSESIQNETRQVHTVPFYQNITQDTPSKTRTKPMLDDIHNAQTESVTLRKRASEHKTTIASETFKISQNEISLSNSCQLHSSKDSAYHQTLLSKPSRYAALSKSASHHTLGQESHKNGTFNGGSRNQSAVPLPPLSRSATQSIPASDTTDGPSMSIADRLAALQRSGSTNWKRRAESVNLSDASYSCASTKEEWSIKQGVLADCLGKLESAAEGWKKRIAATDVSKFTVAGRMKVDQHEQVESGPTSPLIEVTGNISDRKKKTPRPERFKAKKEYIKDVLSMPTSPNKDIRAMTRGSFSEPTSDDSGEESRGSYKTSSTVSVPKTDDETFTSFFTGISLEKCETECLDLDQTDFDVITSQSELLVQRRNIRIQRRRVASKNPIKLLAARTDLRSEYTDIRTGVAERVLKQLNVEKLAKHSTLAVEALAGLASTEDFSTVTLRNAAETNVSANKLQPYKDLMLMLVKGRRHVQVRLVEPVIESVNSGDNFILVTKSEVFNYVGKYSNVIEKARGAEIALSIQQHKDLGTQASQVITINEEKINCSKSQLQTFWNYLGAEEGIIDVIDGGHPDEDEVYESAMIDTNMVYELKGDELVPIDKYWGAIPKIEMLDPNKVLVFDFGTEMYIWSGKAASAEKKRITLRLATEMWNEGYDYTECTICPINAASMIGRRNKAQADLKNAKIRPEWCLLAKVTQHVETVLFREKFLDWPNVTGIIRVREPKMKEQVSRTISIEPCNVSDILTENRVPVDLTLEGSHLGRGTGWYDDDLKKQSVVATTNVTVWHIDEFLHTLVDKSSVGQFYSADSYIIRWMYSITITGRELSGLPSKHAAKGRNRSVFFIWQGKNASLNEQGAAALLTIELDNDQAPQIRIVEGHEPAAFLNLFSGSMMIHSGKRSDESSVQRWKLYICRGCLESEIFLVQIPCSTRQLRSRGCLVLLDTKKSIIYVWYGSNALPHIKKNVYNAVTKLLRNRPLETGLSKEGDIKLVEINEGDEPEEFYKGLGGTNRKLYVSLPKNEMQEHTPRLFYLSCISKEFKAMEVLCPHRAHLPMPFPFMQEELYDVNQPALFLLDNKSELWVWQGWWPDDSAEDQTGSKAVRWQAERKIAMAMALEYWQNLHAETSEFPVYLVWAGLEPLQFINLFPSWTYRDDIAKLNIEDGRNSGEVLTVESELARLTQSTYPPAQLLQRPLPEGVDPTRLEIYLSQQHFQELLGMSKTEFEELPAWKQANLKKEIGLF